MPELEHYNEHELRMIAEVLGMRIRSVLMQQGVSPRDANTFLAERMACALKIAHADGELLAGPVRKLRVVA